MSPLQTVERVNALLESVFSELHACLALPDATLEYRPGYEDAWTILEHLEHVALANHFLLLTIKKGCRIALRRAAQAPVPEGESDLDLLAPIATPDAFEWMPPSHMLPTGKKGRAEVADELRRQREECLELLSGMTRGEGRLYSIRMSVNRLGRMDMYQWLYFLGQHAKYHLELISKVGGAVAERPPSPCGRGTGGRGSRPCPG